ncbi:hypothetical protein GCM10025879_05480 [Leuconostoc litchii]|nr:hypothetical protein GCM10025879_05480 [Leuconostoc litchii]
MDEDVADDEFELVLTLEVSLLSCTGVCVASLVALLSTCDTSLLATEGAAETLVEELIIEDESDDTLLLEMA